MHAGLHAEVAFSVDIAAITAAPPDMSVFIVSMPRRGLDRQTAGVEHDALADERERLLRARAARTRAARTAAARSEPWPTPSTPPMRSRSSWSTVQHLHLQARSRARAAARASATVFGRLRLGRFVDEVARPRAPPPRSRAPRAERRLAPSRWSGRAPRRASASTACASRLVLEELVRRRGATPSASACAASPSSSESGAASSSVVATFATFDARAGQRRARPAQARRRRACRRRRRRRARRPWRRACPASGTASVSPRLPLEVGLRP